MSKLSVEGRVSFYALPPRWQADAQRNPDLFARTLRPVYTSSNLIVTSGLQWISRKLGHVLGTPPVQVGGETVSDIDDLLVSKIKLGNKSSPTAPSAGDTALDDLTPILTITSLTVSYPANGTVRHSGTISPDTLNGEAITEIGLFCTINSNDVLIGKTAPSPVVVIVPATAYLATYDIILTAS